MAGSLMLCASLARAGEPVNAPAATGASVPASSVSLPQLPAPQLPALERTPLGVPAKASAVSEASRTPTSIAGNSLQVAIALVMVVGAIVLVGVVIRKVARRSGGLLAAVGPGGRSPSGVIEVLGRFPLGRGATLVLLKLDRRVLLVSMGSAGMSTLCEITDPDEVASILLKTRDEAGESIAKQFARLMQHEEAHASKAMKVVAAGSPTTRAPARGAGPRLEVRA